MNADRDNLENAPIPEEPVFADGELLRPGAETSDAEAWLRDHPDAAGEVQSLRNFVSMWQDYTVSEPLPAAWERTLQNIECSLAQPRPRPVPWGGSLLSRLGLGGLVAAGFAGLLAVRFLLPGTEPKATEPVLIAEEPYPVASSDEITIISMDPRESRSLVVGRPPIPGDLEWANFDDVTVENAKPNAENQVPEMHKSGNKPMIVPTGSWGGTDKE
jgi:hypothetical protein